MQTTRQGLFLSKSVQASDAFIAVSEGLSIYFGFHHLLSRQFTHDLFESLTVHAKHLADFTLAASSSSASFGGRSLSNNNERARCNRERTVPIAQPRTAAVS